MELYFPLILDGATGTELVKRGYDGSMAAESWVIRHPEAIQEIHRGYIEAGSDIVYAPTFGANRVKLEENGIFNQVPSYNKKLVQIAKEGAQGRALVAGDLSPTGKFLEPLGDVTFPELVEIYREQAQALEEAGVDLFVIETIMTVPEARAALLAVREVSDKPVLVSFTCENSGRTLTGTDVRAALVILQSMGANLFGLNCSAGPKEMLVQIRRLREVAEVPLAVKPNAGLPQVVDGRTVYDCPAEEFVKYIPDFIAAGAAVFGGCCGTDASHIAAIRAALKDFRFKRPAVSPKYRGMLLCATEKEVVPLKPGIRADRVLACGPELEEQIEEENDRETPVIAIRIDAPEDLDEFGACQYAIRKPLCLVCEDAELLDQALALYQGRALYAGELPEDVLIPLARKYGVII
ncbi:MAG: homocysteine S-methyltransferase family protein [Mogibacterium sp.]|nr:homocysteine S-methyltransferase family protein [Mogibacterium sp.]